MRILHISKFYPPFKGGLEHVVRCLAEGAVREGHEVTVICAADPTTRRGAGKREEGVVRGAINHPAIQRSSHQAIPLSRYPTVIRSRTLGTFWSQPVAAGYFRTGLIDADIVHIHHPNPLADLGLLLSRKRPTIVTHHSDVRRQALVRPLYWPVVKGVLDRAGAIAVPTEAHVTVSRELDAFREKVRIIPFGVDHRRFSPQVETGRPAIFPDGPVGLFVGRFVWYKGLDLLVRAVEGTELKVVLAGTGPLEEEIRATVARAGLGRQIILAGEVDDEDLPAYYGAADYVVLPSTAPAEMFGITLTEAMAAGKPVISTRLPTGVREVNRAGETGLEVEPGNVEDLRRALQRLAEDPSECRRLGEAGRKRVERFFTLDGMVQAHLELYEEMVGA